MTSPADRALDRLNLLVASSQTGFGAFVAVFLTARAWTQADIGEALSIGTATAVISQVPAGALVDWMRSKRLAIGLGGAAIMVSALLLASVPARLPVYLAEVLHGFASCMISPAIAAVSLDIARGRSLGARLGRNARFSSIGSGVAAGVLGAVGSYGSNSAVFWLTAAVMGVGLFSLRALPGSSGGSSGGSSQDSSGGSPQSSSRAPRPAHTAAPRALLHTARALLSRPFVLFALALAGFQLGNAAMLPLVAGEITHSAGRWATLVIAAGIVLPQFVVAALSGPAGTWAERRGRRPVLVLGFAALPVRGLLLAWTQDPIAVVLVQALDGLSGAALGVLMPLVAADLAGRLGAFNLCMGLFGLAGGVGATLSTLLAGAAADAYGLRLALLGLGVAGLLATALVAIMPETGGPETGAPRTAGGAPPARAGLFGWVGAAILPRRRRQGGAGGLEP